MDGNIYTYFILPSVRGRINHHSGYLRKPLNPACHKMQPHTPPSPHQSSHSSFPAFPECGCLFPPLPIAAVPIELLAGFRWSAAAERSSQNPRLLSSKLVLTGLYPPADGPSTKRLKPSDAVLAPADAVLAA